MFSHNCRFLSIITILVNLLHVLTQSGVHMGREPFVHRGKLFLTQRTAAGTRGTLALTRAARVVEMDRLEMVFIRVAPRKYTQRVRALVRVSGLEGAPELAAVRACFLPVAFVVAEQVVGPGKAAVANIAHVRPCGRVQMRQFVRGQVQEVEVTLGALALLAALRIAWLGRPGGVSRWQRRGFDMAFPENGGFSAKTGPFEPIFRVCQGRRQQQPAGVRGQRLLDEWRK